MTVASVLVPAGFRLQPAVLQEVCQPAASSVPRQLAFPPDILCAQATAQRLQPTADMGPLLSQLLSAQLNSSKALQSAEG